CEGNGRRRGRSYAVVVAPERRSVASQVAPAIIGPMRRRKDGRWDWRDQNRRALEASYASWGVHKLELEGHAIDNLWSPDYERTRRPEIATRPELALTIDGEQAGLDVTMFITFVASWAAGRGAAIRQEIEKRLTALDDARSILGAVSYA